MPDGLAQIIGAAVGGGSVAGGIIYALLKLLVSHWIEDQKERAERLDAEIKILRQRSHDQANDITALNLRLSAKNGADLKVLDERMRRYELRADSDHQRLGKLEDEQIRLEARHSKG